MVSRLDWFVYIRFIDYVFLGIQCIDLLILLYFGIRFIDLGDVFVEFCLIFLLIMVYLGVLVS